MRGSIQKRNGKRGVTWSVVVDLPRKPDGKRNQKRLTASTRKAVESMLSKTLHEVNSGVYIEGSTQPLEAYLSGWLGRIESNVRPATHHRYQTIIEKQINPALGAIPLGKLTPGHVQDFYAACLARDLSGATVALYHAIRHRALDDAVKRQEALRNVSDAVTAPPSQPARDDHLERLRRAHVSTGNG